MLTCTSRCSVACTANKRAWHSGGERLTEGRGGQDGVRMRTGSNSPVGYEYRRVVCTLQLLLTIKLRGLVWSICCVPAV